MKYLNEILSSFSSKNALVVFLHRLVSVFSGLIILYIVTSLLEIQDQGSYYLILSLVGLQSFVDLGVISVMVSIILREWTEFRSTSSSQIRDRKISIIRGYFHFFIKWYLSLSFVLLLISLFYSYRYKSDNQLFTILLSISIITSLNFFLNLFWLFLEGIADFLNLYVFRAIQLGFSTSCLYLLIRFNFGLSAFIYFYSITFFTSLFFIVLKWNIFSVFFNGSRIKFLYFKDIFPFHFSIFIQSIFGYFTWQALVPLFYDNLGSSLAGKFGVSVQISSLFLSFSTFLIYSKSPIFSKLYLNKNYDQILTIWKRDLMLSYCSFFSFVTIFVLFYYLDLSLVKPFFDRILTITNVILIFLIHSFYIFNQSIAVLTRLNKKEILSISGLLVPILSYILVYLCINFISLNMIFYFLFFLNVLFVVYNYFRFRMYKNNYLSF